MGDNIGDCSEDTRSLDNYGSNVIGEKCQEDAHTSRVSA